MLGRFKSWLAGTSSSIAPRATPVGGPRPVEGYFSPQPLSVLLHSDARRQWLQTLWDYSALPKARYEQYYLAPLHQLVMLMQQLPAEPQGKYAYPGGMVDYVLQTTVFAVRLSKGYLLPRGASAEDQSAQAVSWSAVVFYAALFHHLGALWTIDGELVSGERWTPGLSIPTEAYRFRFHPDASDEAQCSFGALLALRLLPGAVIDWLGQTPVALETLCVFLTGRYDSDGAIEDIIQDAIRHAGGSPLAMMSAPSVPVVPRQAVPPVTSATGALPLAPTLTPAMSPVSPVPPSPMVAAAATLSPEPALSAGLRPSAETAVLPLTSALSSAIGTGLPNAVPESSAEAHTEVQSDPDIQRVMALMGIDVPDDAAVVEKGESEEGDKDSEAPLAATETALTPTDIEAVPTEENGKCDIPRRNERCADDGEAPGLLHMPPFPPAYSDEQTSDSAENRAVSDADSQTSELGELFWAWLRQGLLNNTLDINTAEASIHLTCGFIFISVPAIFYLFFKAHPEIKQTQRTQVQNEFERLSLHRKSQGKRFWQCHLYELSGWEGKHQRLTGYLIKMSSVYRAGQCPTESLLLKVSK